METIKFVGRGGSNMGDRDREGERKEKRRNERERK